MADAPRIDPENLPRGDEKVTAVRDMFDRIAPRYDLINRLLTFRMDVGWRRRTVAALGLVPGSTVADLACGTGDLCRELQGSGLEPLGFDMSYGMLANAPEPFPRCQADALRLPLASASIDGATSGFALRNFVALEPFIAEVARVVRPGGRVALLDVAQPRNALLRRGHSAYFEGVVPFVGGILSDPAAYRYLPKSVAYLPSSDEIVEMMAAHGWRAVRHELFSGGIAQLFSGTRT